MWLPLVILVDCSFCSVIEHLGEASYALMLRELETAFEDQDVPEIVRKMDKHFEAGFSP